ncbi:MAG: tetraacyldisaccharide 4'-kinase [Azoarcus sp.]|nr:tetraacyldisaccharide 4'-kinase [Azoarcus sp.]
MHPPAFWRRRGALALTLLPLAGLFASLAALRRTAYRRGWLPADAPGVPVIVVGNIAVGGSGKTPVVQWLIDVLRVAGFSPGIVSRGHGGSERGPALVPADGDAARFGDEPVLLARVSAAPLVIGRDRPAAVRRLLEAHPQCDVVVADDGLQHYRLARQIEIAVVDEFQLGNRLRLPAGPLREGLSRLAEADLVFAHGPLSASVRSAAGEVPVFDMRLHGDELVSIDGTRRVALTHFAGRRVHAIAGIGRPQRFFDQLSCAGLEVVGHAFPDHHAYRPEDLAMASDEPKILTSKDAVKCAAFAPPGTWVLPVRACIDAAASQLIVEKLTHGIPPA